MFMLWITDLDFQNELIHQENHIHQWEMGVSG